MGLFEFQGAPSSRDQYENSELLFEEKGFFEDLGSTMAATAVDTWENYNSIGIALYETNQFDFLDINPESHYSRFIQDQVSVDGYFDPVEFGERHYEKVTQRGFSRMLQPDEIKEKFGHLNMKSDKAMSMYQLQVIAQSRRDAAMRDQVFERSMGGFTQGVLSFGTALAVSIVDPINIAIAFIPIAGEAKWAEVIGRAGLISRKAFNLGRRVVGAKTLPLAPIRTFGQLGRLSKISIRAGSGAIENVIVDTPIELALADYRLEHKLQDTTNEEFIMAISMSAIIGGFLRPLGGAISDFRTHRALVRSKKLDAEAKLLVEDLARVHATKNNNATLTDKHAKATQETILETQQVVLGEALNDRDPQIGTTLLDKDPNASRPEAPFVPAKVKTKAKARTLAISPGQVTQAKDYYRNVAEQIKENEDIIQELVNEGASISEAWKQVLGPKEAALIDDGFHPNTIREAAESKVKDLESLEERLDGSLRVFDIDESTPQAKRFSVLLKELNEVTSLTATLEEAVNELDSVVHVTKGDQNAAVKKLTKKIKGSAAETADQLDAELAASRTDSKVAKDELQEAFDDTRGITPEERAEITAKHEQELDEPLDRGKGNNEEDFLRDAEEIHGTEDMAELREIIATHNGDGGVADARVNEDIPNTPEDKTVIREEVTQEELEIEVIRLTKEDKASVKEPQQEFGKQVSSTEIRAELNEINTQAIELDAEIKAIPRGRDATDTQTAKRRELGTEATALQNKRDALMQTSRDDEDIIKDLATAKENLKSDDTLRRGVAEDEHAILLSEAQRRGIGKEVKKEDPAKIIARAKANIQKRKDKAKELTGDEEDLHTILTKGIDTKNNEIDYSKAGPKRPVIFNESYVDDAYIPDLLRDFANSLIRLRKGEEPRAGRNMNEMAILLAKATGIEESQISKAIIKVIGKGFKPNANKPPFILMMQELGIDGIEFRGQLKEWAKKVGAIQFGTSGATNRVDLSGRYLSSFSPSKQAKWGLVGADGKHSATRISRARLDELIEKDIDLISNDGATISSDPRPNGETYFHLYDAETGKDVGVFTSLDDARDAWENAKAELSRFNGTEIIREGGIDFKREAGIIEPELPLKGNPHLRQMSGQKWDILINGRVVKKGITGKAKAVHTLTTLIDPKHERLPMTYDEILAFGLDKRSVAYPPEVSRKLAKTIEDKPRPVLPDTVLVADANDVADLDELLQAWATFNSKQEIPVLADLSISERRQVLTTLFSDVYNRDNLREGGTPLGLFIAEEGFDGIHIPDQGTIKLEKDHIAFMKSERDQVDNLATSNRSEAEEIKQRNEDMQDSHGPVSDAREAAITTDRLTDAQVVQKFHTDLQRGVEVDGAQAELQHLTREAELELEEALLDLREVTGDDDLTFGDLAGGESSVFRIMAEAEQAGARSEDVKVAMDKYISCLRRG